MNIGFKGKVLQVVIDDDINVRDAYLTDGLIPVVRIMARIGVSKDEDVEISFSHCKFISPVFVLSLIVFLSGCGKRVKFSSISGYLSVIGFGFPSVGICPDEMRRSEFIAVMRRYDYKTYVPIVNFPAKNDFDDKKDDVSSIVENLIIRQVNIPSNVATGLKYMIEEALDNITEHSESDRGFIFAQAYPIKGYVDVCVADRGITLLGSYKRSSDSEISSDIEAIKAANRGISSKNLPDAENRGYGIYTSKRMLVEGLRGQYLMISGGNFYFKTPYIDGFYVLPNGMRWQGTIVAFRIPYNDGNFNYINYIE